MIIAIILAKAESGRLPGKNMRRINELPLFVHAIRYAKASRLTGMVVVSTDSDEIARIASAEGAEVVRRGQELCGDAPNAAVINHALACLRIGGADISHVVCLQPDHPGRQVPLDDALRYAIDKKADILLSVHRDGVLSGSFRIYSHRALSGCYIVTAHAMMDDCRNIHTEADLLMAAHDMSPYSREIAVAGRKIGRGHPCFIVAEAGCNHLCDLGRAKEMIAAAKWAGADAIKFQTYKAERLVRKDAPLYWGGREAAQMEYYQKLDRFGPNEYASLFAHAKKLDIIAFSTPFDLPSADMLRECGAPLFKIASCDLPDIRLIRHVARFQTPMIISTGASTPGEIDRAVLAALGEGNHRLILTACVLAYPAFRTEANLLRIRSLKERYPRILVGCSDHTEPDTNMVIPAIVAALGAHVIEKHFTLDRALEGSGNYFATPPEEFKKMTDNIRLAEIVLGNGSMDLMDSESVARDKSRRSIVAGRGILAGDFIVSDALEMKRPGEGLLGWEMDAMIGKRAKVNIAEDEALTKDMVE